MFRMPEPKITGVGIVRDRNGMPKVDGNPDDLPAAIKALFTEDEMNHLRRMYNGDTDHGGA